MAQLNLERGVPRDKVFLSAKDFINPNKTISSEDLGTIQSRMATSAGVPESAIQLTKNYTKEDMEKLGAKDSFGPGGNDQLDALQDYYEFAQKQFNMGKSPSAIRDSANIGSSLYGLNMDLVPKDFLETREDFQKQISPIKLFTDT
jgi:muramidase (phage lysozyme)